MFLAYPASVVGELTDLLGNSEQVEKAEKMANARKQVRRAFHVGRKGNGGRDAALVRKYLHFGFIRNIPFVLR
jgi:hypothetical protein